jgi:nicotinamidase-related amidase
VPLCARSSTRKVSSAMSEPYVDLPEPESDFDERLVADVREHGWHCILVAEEHHPEHAALNAALRRHPVYDAAFAYTVGLWLTRDHPELVLVGRWQQAQPSSRRPSSWSPAVGG